MEPFTNPDYLEYVETFALLMCPDEYFDPVEAQSELDQEGILVMLESNDEG
jgi:hypothetical protein